MSSSYSMSFRLNYQAPGDNLNLWGTVLNTAVFQLLEDAVAGLVSFTLSGTKTLTVVNGGTDEARCMVLNVTGGTGGTITAPAVKKLYLVRNGSVGDVIITAGGASATVASGQTNWVWSDGTDFRIVRQTDFSGARLTNVGYPVATTDAASKAYVDAVAFATQIGDFPGLTGNAGKALVVSQDETTVAWQAAIQFKSANFTCDRNVSYAIDTTSGVVTATLPASPEDGDRVGFADQGILAGGFAVNKLVVGRNGKKILGLSEDMDVTIRNAQFALAYKASAGDWRFSS